MIWSLTSFNLLKSSKPPKPKCLCSSIYKFLSCWFTRSFINTPITNLHCINTWRWLRNILKWFEYFYSISLLIYQSKLFHYCCCCCCWSITDCLNSSFLASLCMADHVVVFLLDNKTTCCLFWAVKLYFFNTFPSATCNWYCNLILHCDPAPLIMKNKIPIKSLS